MGVRPRRFRAVVLDGQKGCAVQVPFDPAEEWGELPTEIVYQRVRGVPVRGKLEGESFESWIILRWKKHFLLLDDTVLRASTLAPGELASIEVAPRVKAVES
ncbi:MAG: DUF1905 domain-containing protein [Planctomycetes bacterium]|nr:DUF1905 domain-containing protein [Planctomycetota bacterium]